MGQTIKTIAPKFQHLFPNFGEVIHLPFWVKQWLNNITKEEILPVLFPNMLDLPAFHFLDRLQIEKSRRVNFLHSQFDPVNF